ncbi:MAG: DUF4176 domain-containing protein [bacterium]|nr:DUF4176 domain-containing protein [bacterium]
MKERFLPIGSVVMLNGGKKEVMITSYCIFPIDSEIKDGKQVPAERKMYEYGGCIYPEGILDSNVSCAFNHDQIAEILHVGYETEKQKQLSQILNTSYEKYKEKYESEGTLE